MPKRGVEHDRHDGQRLSLVIGTGLAVLMDEKFIGLPRFWVGDLAQIVEGKARMISCSPLRRAVFSASATSETRSSIPPLKKLAWSG